MNDRIFTIICCLITFILSLISSLIIKKYDNSMNMKEKKYNEFYKEFYILWNKIHQGRAFNFINLSLTDREKIIDFLLENYNYASVELQKMIYELKTNRLNNFDSNNKINIEICNQCYNNIIEYMVEKEQKYRKKYNNLKF